MVFKETLNPVVKPVTIRIILNLALHYDWIVKQLDVSNAFLHGHLVENVFMHQPVGFVNPSYPHYVCKLNKSLYGLK